MDNESRSTVELNVLLKSGLLGFVNVTAKASIQKSESISHSPVSKEFHDGPAQ